MQFRSSLKTFKTPPRARLVPSARKTKSISAGGNFGVVTNVNELEAMLSHIDEKLPLIIAQAVDSIMEKVRQSTQRELFKHIGQGQIPNAPRQIAFAIKSEEIRYDQARNEITGRFFVDGRGKGVLTARDDDGNRFNVAKALEEGMAAQMVYFIGFSSRGRFGGAKKWGRQFGTIGSKTGWTLGHPGRYYHKGFPEVAYMAHAQLEFKDMLEQEIQKRINDTYGPKAFYGKR